MKNVVIFSFLLMSNLLFAQKKGFVNGELIVHFQKGFDYKSYFNNINSENSSSLIQLKETLDSDWNFHLVTFDTMNYSNEEILYKVNKSKNVLSVQLNEIASTRSVEPNDPLYLNKQKWVMDKIHAPELWDLTTGGKTSCGDEPVIAVLDFGFDINHEDLKENLWINKLEIPGDGIDNDGNGYIDDINGLIADRSDGIYEKLSHGTSCVGVIGSVGNNNKGITGLNWKTKTMLLGHAYTAADMIKLYSYTKNMRKMYNATNGKKGAYIVATSMSLGFNNGDPNSPQLKPLCDVYDLLGEEGILNVTATTNSNENVDKINDVTSLCPSDYLIVVTSTSIDDQNQRGFSPKNVDLGAPGEKVELVNIDNAYFSASGTSFAAPLVAGAVGLFYSIPNNKLCEESKSNPKVTPLIIKNAILSSVTKITGLANRTVSGGILNVWDGAKELIKHYSATPNVENRIEKVYVKDGKLKIDFYLSSFNNYSLLISNVLGQSVFSKDLTSLDLINGKIDIENILNPGIFSVTIRSDKDVYSKMFSIFSY